MKSLRIIAAAVGLICSCATFAQTQGTLNYNFGNGQYVNFGNSGDWTWQFTLPSITGLTSSTSWALGDGDPSSNPTFTVTSVVFDYGSANSQSFTKIGDNEFQLVSNVDAGTASTPKQHWITVFGTGQGTIYPSISYNLNGNVVTTVPEPETLGLMAAGLLAIALRRKSSRVGSNRAEWQLKAV